MKVVQVIEKRRKEQKISQSKLCQGLCSLSLFSRIERGEKQGDRMILEACFERLGSTMVYWEKILNNNDIRLYELQRAIQFFLEKGEVNEVERLLLKYKDFKGVSEKLHKQYKLWVEAKVLQLQNQTERALERITEALEITLPNFFEKDFSLKKHYLCHQEIRIYLMWLQLCQDSNKEAVCQQLKVLLEYVRERIKDTNYLERITLKILYVLISIEVQVDAKEEALKHCKEAIEIQRKAGSLEYVKQLLAIQLELEKKMGLSQQNEDIRGWYEALEFLEYAPEDELDKKPEMIRSKDNIYGIGQVFKSLRKEYNLSQEEAIQMESEKGIVRETISRIENGHKNPTRRTCETYLKQFKKEIKFYSTRVDSDDYDVHMLQHDMAGYMGMGKSKEAREVLEKIEEKLDLNNPYNMQYIQAEKLFLDYIEKKIEGEAYREKLIEVLELSVEDYKKIENSKTLYGFFNQNEVGILNNIAFSYIDQKEKNYEQALKLQKKLLDYLERQYMLMGSGNYLMILANYVNVLGSYGEYKESNALSKKGIYIIMANKKNVRLIHHFLYNIAWNMKEEGKKRTLSNKERQECVKVFEVACKMSRLFLDDTMIKFLEQQKKDFITPE